jgi:formylmethanofuran dehydrogenase subunit E
MKNNDRHLSTGPNEMSAGPASITTTTATTNKRIDIKNPFFEPDWWVLKLHDVDKTAEKYHIDERIMSYVRCRSCGEIVIKPKGRPSRF